MGLFDMFKKPSAQAQGGVQKVKDPVCGMMLNPAKAEGEDVRVGKKYYFCSINCQQTFRRNPLNFIEKDAPSTTPESKA